MTSLNLASSQAKSVFDLLCKHNHLSAKEIGVHLGILPNAVYRATDQLLNLGVIEKQGSYPVRYSVVASTSALGWFLLLAQRSFKETFYSQNNQPTSSANNPTVSFIKGRNGLLKRTDKDTAAANQEVNFIVSGLEVPDDTILVYRKAITQGVKIRALLQKRNDTSKAKLEKWKDIGVDIRFIDDLGVRLFVFDSRVVCITSYNQNKKEEAFGVRFDYAPLAVMMQDLFEQKWEQAQS